MAEISETSGSAQLGGSPEAVVHETLMALSILADRQAARAAALDEITSSSALFILGDELRTSAVSLRGREPEVDSWALLVTAWERIESATSRLDAVEAGMLALC